MIRFFSLQAIAIRQETKGQALPLVLITLATLIAMAYATVYVCHLGAEKVRAVDRVDAIALSAATWEARGLNVISGLNDGILQCLKLITWVASIWAALAIAAAFGLGIPAFTTFSNKAPKLIKNYWDTARRLSEMAEKVRRAIPFIVLAETASLMRSSNVAGALYPINPNGTHDEHNTLELHLKKSAPISIISSLGPITKIINTLRKLRKKHKGAKFILGILEPLVGKILTGAENIQMLVQEDDFEKRQFVTFTGSYYSKALPIPVRQWSESKTFGFISYAEPYGGSPTAMNWRSRLIENKDVANGNQQ